MTYQQRLGLSLALCVGVAGFVFAAAQWWRKPAPEPPAVEASTKTRDAREARIEELRSAIEAQRTALQRVRQHRGQASAELDQLTDQLSVIRERIDGLQEQVQGQGSGAE